MSTIRASFEMRPLSGDAAVTPRSGRCAASTFLSFSMTTRERVSQDAVEKQEGEASGISIVA